MSIIIPKKIHQTWKTDKLPDKWKSSQESIKKYMPHWEYKLWTDDDNRELVIKYFPDFLYYYDKFEYNIQRADAIRYIILYLEGGLYMDCDFELLSNIDELFEDGSDLYLNHSSNNKNLITNGFMASVPGLNIWLYMIDSMKRDPGFYKIEKHYYVMNTTGPMALDRVVRDNNIKYKRLPSEKINPYTMCEKEYNSPNALMKPLEGSSWVSPTGLFVTSCYCEPNYYVTSIIIIIALLLLLVVIYNQ